MAFDQPKQEYGPISNVQASSVEQDKPKHSYRMIIITVAVILVSLAGYFVSQNQNLQQIMKKTVNFSGDPSQVRTQNPNGSGAGNNGTESMYHANESGTWVEISPVQERSSYPVNENVTLKVKGFSNGKDITGFDILVMYDKSVFDLVSTSSLADGFSIFANNSRDHLTVTGIKDIGKTSETAFSGNDLIQVVLKPKKTGTFNVEILNNVGKEKTQLVDRDVNAYTPRTNAYTVQVQ